MSLRSRVGLTVRPSPAWWSSTAVWITLLLCACSPAVSGSATPSRPALGLSASSSGVCQAMIALPDLSAAEHAFTNVAHDALHRLAADPRLGRPIAARVLEAMQKVEADFSRSSDVVALTGDLRELQASADTALRAIGEEVPGCAG
jgi:type II secretory pathway predicted ATPase ExeA